MVSALVVSDMGMTFEIPGPPIPKGRPRYNRQTGTWYTPKRTTDYEEHVAWCAIAAGVRLEPGTHYDLEIDLHLSSYNRDRDNMLKCIQDGLQRMGDGWDDRCVWGLVLRTVAVKDAAEEKAVVTLTARPRVPVGAKNRTEES